MSPENNEIKCPYCLESQPLLFDHNFGYVKGRKHHQSCPHCSKKFVYQTEVIMQHTPSPAKCLNGGQHNLQPLKPTKSNWPNWQQCTTCGEDYRGGYVEGL